MSNLKRYVCRIHTVNHYNKLLFNLVFVGETLRHERYHESIVFPANHLANVLTNKTKRHRKIHNSMDPNNYTQ